MTVRDELNKAVQFNLSQSLGNTLDFIGDGIAVITVRQVNLIYRLVIIVTEDLEVKVASSPAGWIKE